MRYNLLFSVLFSIVAVFSAMHQTEHIYNQDTSDCVMCVIDNNLASADIEHKVFVAEEFSYEAVLSYKHILFILKEKSTNQNRAPPKIS